MPRRRKYFSPRTIDPLSSEMFFQVLQLVPPGREALSPERSALLVLDMQRFFLERSSHAFVPSAPAILPRVERLVQAYRARRLPVIFTRHENTPDDAGQMARRWRDLIRPGSPEAELVLDPAGAPVIVKHQYDAFHQTGLEALLRERGVEQVVITGVMTHLCCETTARSAFVRGFQVFFVVDGTATYNEEFHRATLINLSHGFAEPTLSALLMLILSADDEDEGDD